LFFTMLQSGLLGALLTLSHRIWYPLQASGVAAHGLTALEDQQLAGLIMWVPGGLLYLVGMAVLFLGFIREVGGPSRDAVAVTAT
jgi:putative membrane protein